MKQDCVKTVLANAMHPQQPQMHKQAKQPGIPLSLAHRCPCCQVPYEKQPLPFCFPQKSTLHLGPGPALYFRFLLLCCITILVPTLAYAIVTIITNLNQESTASFLYRLSNLNSLHGYNWVYSYVLAGAGLGMLVGCPLGVKWGFRVEQMALAKENQYFYPQCLALLFKLDRPANLTQQQVTKTLNQWYETQLKIQNKNPEQPNIVQHIYFLFNLQAYETLKHELTQLQKQRSKTHPEEDLFNPLTNYDSKHGLSKRSYSSKQSQNRELMGRFGKIEVLREKIRARDVEQTGKFVVVFRGRGVREVVRLGVDRGMCRRVINKLIFPKDNPATVQEAPYPCQINYNVQHLPYKAHKLPRRILSHILTLALLLLGTGIQYLTLYLLTTYSSPQLLSYGPLIQAGVIYLSSQLCIRLAFLLVGFQVRGTKSEEEVSGVWKGVGIGVGLRCVAVYGVGAAFGDQGFLVQTVSWLAIIWPSLLLISRFLNLSLLQSCLSPNTPKPSPNLALHTSHLLHLFLCSLAFASLVPFFLITVSIFFLLEIFVERFVFVFLYAQPRPSGGRLYGLAAWVLWRGVVAIGVGQFCWIYLGERLGVSSGMEVKIVFLVLLVLAVITMLVPTRLSRPGSNNELTYEMIKDKLVNTYEDFNPLYKLKSVTEVQKSAIRLAAKSQMLAEELNTMSKSLETTLRDKLFMQKSPCLEALNNREQDSLYFQFDNKVKMPEKPVHKQKSPVPPIFKQNRQDLLLRKKSRKQERNTKDLVKLTNLACQQQAEIKNKIKTAIRGSINKIN